MVEKISLQAVTREQAYANLNAQKARQQVPKGIAYMAGIFGLIPILYISLEGPHPIAISAVVILYGLVTACLWWTWSLARQAGYRINRRFAAVGWLPVIVVAADIVLWTRWSRMPRQDVRLRRVTATIAAVLPTFAVLLLFIMVVNLSTVAATAPALAAFFGGSL